MNEGPKPRGERLNGRLPVQDLGRRLALLLRKRGHSRLRKLADLAEMLKCERIQWHRTGPGRRPGIPAEYLDDFLRIFNLTEDNLQLPLDEFQKLLDTSPSCTTSRITSWDSLNREDSRRIKRPQQCQQRADLLQFQWSAEKVNVQLKPFSRSPLAPPPVAAMRQRPRPATAQIYQNTDFQIHLEAHGTYRRMLVVAETEEMLVVPLLLPPGRQSFRQQLPSRDGAYYFDTSGRHILSVALLMSMDPQKQAELEEQEQQAIDELSSRDVRARCAALDRICMMEDLSDAGPPLVLQVALDVIPTGTRRDAP